MKKRKVFLILLLITVLLLVNIPLAAEAVLEEELISESIRQDDLLEKADQYEIEQSFVSMTDWKTHLQKRNETLSKSDLSHEVIQLELSSRGLAGLNKYQYYQLLTEEQPTSMSENELLVVFDDDEKNNFSIDEYNSLFVSFEECGDYLKGRLKQDYDSSKLISLIGMLINDPNVLYIQPNFVYELASSAYITADYTYTLTRAMEQVNAADAWSYYTGQNVLVGLIDSGINTLSGQNVHPHSTNDCRICDAHGSSVSTVIAGNFEYAGVAPNSNVLCISTHGHSGDLVLSSSVIGDVESLVNDYGCRIINMSLNSIDDSLDTFLSNVQSEYNNVLFVHSAGNNGLDCDNMTAYDYYNNSNYIRVAAVDMNDDLWYSSNYGRDTVHIAAPGENLSLPSYGGSMILKSGTSFAAPFVSGTAALLLEANSNLSAAQLKNYILNSADHVSVLETCVQGGRRLNVMAALSNVSSPTSERYAYLTSGGVLYARDNANPSMISIDTGVANFKLAPEGILYQKASSSYIYFVPGEVNSEPTIVDDSGTAVSYSASLGNLVIYTGSQLKRYYYDGDSVYDYYATHNNVICYALSGNRLALFYSTSAKFRIYENIQTSTAYEIYSVNGSITALWVTGPRLHVYQQSGKYQLFDSVSGSRPTQGSTLDSSVSTQNRKWLDEVYESSNFSFITSMNEYRWCYASGSNLYLYGFYGENGTMETSPTIISSPTGGSITECKLIDYRIYFKVGSTWYAKDDDSDTLYILTGTLTNAVFCGDNIGYLQSDKKFYVKSGELSANRLYYGDNAVSIAVSY